jgi:AraC-like DNA-binding protein
MARLDIKDWGRWQKAAEESGYHAAKIASDLGVSRRQLYRYTIAVFGRGPQEWLHDLRLLAAGQMLRDCRSAKRVALDLGFKQISHFSREFKLFYGLTPTAFLAWADGQKSSAVGYAVQTSGQPRRHLHGQTR